MRRIILFTLLALALPTAVLASPLNINFVVVPIGGTPSYVSGVNPGLQNSTAFSFGGGLYTVSIIGSGDQSGLSAGNTVTLASTFTYGSGNSGSTDLTKSWSDSLGSFTETFTSFTADRSTANAITLTLFGTLSAPGGVTESVRAILSANQAGGPGKAVGWSLTESLPTPVPEPGTLEGLLLGIGVLGLPGLARRKLKLGT